MYGRFCEAWAIAPGPSSPRADRDAEIAWTECVFAADSAAPVWAAVGTSFDSCRTIGRDAGPLIALEIPCTFWCEIGPTSGGCSTRLSTDRTRLSRCSISS
jgi:hypothetical protein